MKEMVEESRNSGSKTERFDLITALMDSNDNDSEGNNTISFRSDGSVV